MPKTGLYIGSRHDIVQNAETSAVGKTESDKKVALNL